MLYFCTLNESYAQIMDQNKQNICRFYIPKLYPYAEYLVFIYVAYKYLLKRHVNLHSFAENDLLFEHIYFYTPIPQQNWKKSKHSYINLYHCIKNSFSINYKLTCEILNCFTYLKYNSIWSITVMWFMIFIIAISYIWLYLSLYINTFLYVVLLYNV